MKTPKEFTEEYTNLTANGIKPSLLYLEEQVYKLMQAYVNYVKVNNVVLDDVIKCEQCKSQLSKAEFILCVRCSIAEY